MHAAFLIHHRPSVPLSCQENPFFQEFQEIFNKFELTGRTEEEGDEKARADTAWSYVRAGPAVGVG